MTEPGKIPADSIAVIDTSVLFAMGGPENEKYHAFQRFATRTNLTVTVPEQVARELGESPDVYTYQRDRLRAAQEAGWLTSTQIDFTISGVPGVVDRTRQRMAKRSAADVSEDEIEKTDTILAGVAYQFATSDFTHVTVFVSDRLAEDAIRDVLDSTSVGERTLVVEGRQFLDRLVDDTVSEG